MVEQLFGSKTRVKLLQLFYSNPNRPFYVREITRKVDEQINSVRRELSNLLSVGIISSETTNNKLFYEVNQKYEYYLPLSQIFGNTPITQARSSSVKSAPISVEVAKHAESNVPEDLKLLGHLELILLTGQFTRDESSGIDFLVVGDINQTQLSKYIIDLEKREDKEVRYVSMPLREYKYRQQINDKFLLKVLESKKQILYDNNLLSVAKDPEAEEEALEHNKKTAKKG